MVLPTTVRRLDVTALDIALREPFGIAQGAQEIARNLLVTIELADGTLGYGEAAPFPAFNGETQESARRSIESVRDAVLGADARGWRAIAAAITQAKASGSARCAIETAVLDALTKRAGMPLWAFFGGVGTELMTDITVTTGSIESARAAAAAHAAAGFRTLKIKVGGGSTALDVERVSAIAAAAPGCALLLDANASMQEAAAIELVLALRALGITPRLFEQPVAADDHAGLSEVARRTETPVAADESVASLDDARRLAASGAVHVLNIKLMKTAIAESLDIVAVARAFGLGLMIGGMVESVLAMTTSACFAAGLGGFAFVDLDTPLFLAENPFAGGYAQRGDVLDLLGIAAGHGVMPIAAGQK